MNRFKVDRTNIGRGKFQLVLAGMIWWGLSGLAFCQEHSVELRRPSAQTIRKHGWNGFATAVYESNFLTGVSKELFDLMRLRIFKPGSSFYDESRNLLFVVEYNDIRVVDLAKKALIGSMPIPSPDDSIEMHIEGGILYAGYYDQKSDRLVTSAFDSKFHLFASIPGLSLQQISASHDGGIHYLFGLDSSTKEGILLALNVKTGKIVDRRRIAEIGLREKEGWVRGGGEGFLLIEYPREKAATKTWTFARYDLEKKLISGRVENVPICDVFLNDSLSRLVARAKKLISRDGKKVWEYTGKGFAYDLVKEKLLGEFAIEKEAELREVRGKLFARTGASVREIDVYSQLVK